MRLMLQRALLLATLLVSSSAQADESVADIVERGIVLRSHGKDDEALALFRRAYEVSPAPRTRVQIGLAEHALGLWALAETDLEVGLAATTDPWIVKNSAAVEGALAIVRRHLGSVEVRTNAASAELVIDGVAAGSLPLARPARLPVGTHRLEVRAPGYGLSARTVDITSRTLHRETFDLGRDASRLEATTRTPPNGPEGPGASDALAGSTQRTVGWAMVGFGAVAGAFAGVSFVVHEGQIRSYNDDASCPGRAAGAQPGPCADKIDAADRWLTVGVATAVGSGMLVLSGLIVALTAPRATAARTVSCVLGCCSVRF